MAASHTQQHLRLVCLEGEPHQYAVDIGVGQLNRVPEVLQDVAPGHRQVVVISDTTVWQLWGAAFRQCFSDAVLPFHLKLVAPGEQSKCRATKAELEDWMVRCGCTRRSVVVAFGGGVVGDLAGFVAATYMRGVPFVQVPTTLLAMVDSSVGGKTAIDTPGGKNLVGAFHQPRAVLIDPALLATLPRRQVNAGMAEVIKAGFIRDEALLAACERLAPAVARKEPAALGWLVAAALRVKLAVVQQDEREAGLRAVLNCGHTVGHGVEALLAPRWLHGECVALGMLREAEAARAMGILADVHVQRLLRCLRDYALPTAEPPGLDIPAAVAKMAADKKNEVAGAAAERSLQCVLVSSPGCVLPGKSERSNGGARGGWTRPVPTDLLLRLMTRQVQIGSGPAAIDLDGGGAVPVRPALPGSKSLTNRLLLLAALAAGRSRLCGALLSDDTHAMLAALRRLGVRWQLDTAEGGVVTIVVEGCAGSLQWPAEGSGAVYVKNAGTAARFLAAALSLLPAAAGRSLVLAGNERMRQRPIAALVAALQAQGASVDWAGERTGSLPLRLGGGGLRGGRLRMSGRVSSQFVSALLLAGPLAQAPLTLQLEEEQPTSLPYIEMTIATMAQFGVRVGRPAINTFVVPTGGYTSPGVVAVEPDASAASYPAAIAAVTDRPVALPGIHSGCLQGDAGFPAHLAAMGCTVESQAAATAITPPRAGELRSIQVDMGDTTDTFLTLAAVAPFASAGSTTVITGVANQRVKECDRIAAVVAGLRAAGVAARERPDGLEVDSLGWGPCPPAPEMEPAAAEAEAAPAVTIACHDDHRVAMAFAVLALGIEHRRRAGVAGARLAPRLVLDDARCVEKTFPAFWDMLSRDFGVQLAAPRQLAGEPQKPGQLGHLPPEQRLLAAAAAARAEAAAALRLLVVIGMRGAGKTTLAQSAAGALGWQFRDTDHALQASAGASCAAVVADRGWPGFRALELDTLRAETEAALAAGGSGVVLACGGGVVETPAARRLLAALGSRAEVHVVWVDRWIADIEHDLGINPEEEAGEEGAAGGEAQRPAYAGGEPLRAVWRRRLPWFEEAATSCFAVPAGAAWTGVEGGFVEHVQRLGALSGHASRLAAAMRHHGCPAAVQAMTTPVAGPVACLAPRSCFVCATAPDLVASAEAQRALAAAAAEGAADCVELRLDLLSGLRAPSACDPAAGDDGSAGCWRRVVKEAVAAARRCVGGLPMLATLRSAGEGGGFSGSPALAAAVLLQAATAGAELVDVEVDRLDPECLQRLLGALGRLRPAPLVVASKHFPEPAPPRAHSDRSAWEGRVSGALARLYACGVPPGRLVVKVVVAAGEAADCSWLSELVSRAEQEWRRAGSAPLACVALAMGAAGQLSRVTNRAFTPVTHPALPAAAAPGQLSAADIRRARAAVGLERAARFALFGSPIALSASPAMHNAAFGARGLPWSYELQDTSDHAAVAQALAGGGVVGGSVTMPHKQAVAPLCAAGVCPAAAALGAVNTLAPTPGGLAGHNTDWIGIAAPLARLLGPGRPDSPSRALIVGAGGTARAAAFAAAQLGLLPVILNPRTPARGAELAASLGSSWGVPVVAAASAEAVPSGVAAILSTLPGSAGFTAPPRLLESRPVVLDAAYVPRRTALLAQAEAASCPVVFGLDMLIQQALAQAAIWTGLPPLQRTIAEAAREHYATAVACD